MYDAERLAGGGFRPLLKSFDWRVRNYISPSLSGQDCLDALQKALNTGAGVTNASFQASLLENLDSAMTEVLITNEHLKLFRALPRVPSIQPLFQWIRHTGFGNHRRAPGFVEGGGPKAGNSSWLRGNATIRWMGVRRGYTHQLMVTGEAGGTFTDPVAAENRDGTLELLEIIERWLTWGNGLILDESGNTVNYDGIYHQLLAGRPASIIDLEGQPLTFDNLEDYALRLVTDGKLLNFANIQTLWEPKILTDLAQLKIQSERAALRENATSGYRPGTPIKGYDSQHGYLPLDSSLLLKPVGDNGEPLASAQTGAPTKSATVTGAEGDDATSKMAIGTYYYFVSAFNDTGESDTRASTGVAVTAVAKKVTLTIANATGATGYRVYRGTTNVAADARWIATIPQGVGNISFVDLNQIRPGTHVGMILHMAPEDVAISQMAPLTKMPLPQVDTTFPFLLLLYHVLVVKAPERVLFIKNIGDRTT